MKISLNDGEFRLIPSRPMGLRGGVGARIVCTHGTLWITAEGCTDDIFLAPGEAYVITSAGLVLIEGLVESGVRIETVPANATRPGSRTAAQRYADCSRPLAA